MKKICLIVLAVLALSVAPSAFADDTPSASMLESLFAVLERATDSVVELIAPEEGGEVLMSTASEGEDAEPGLGASIVPEG